MNFDFLKNYQFFLSLGSVTIAASAATMVLTQIAKVILKKLKKIYPAMDPTRKDILLSRVGRIIALICYTGLYIGNEFYLKHTIVFNEELIAGLLSGGALTLTLAKGFYTTLRQFWKKQGIFEKLKYAEETIAKLQQPVQNSESGKQEIAEKIVRELTAAAASTTEDTGWILTNKK